MINYISEFVSSEQINSQEAFLFLLIDSGVNRKEDLSIKTNLSIRTIERQLKHLAQANLIKKDLDKWSTKKSLVFESNNISKVSSNIDINDLDCETKDALIESAININVDPNLLLVKLKEILGDKKITPKVLIEASTHTKNEVNNKYRSNPVRHPLAFFLGVVRNMYKNGIAKLLSLKQSCNKTWEKIKSQIKKHMAKSSFDYFINKIIVNENDNTIYLYTNNKSTHDFIFNQYLGSIMYYASKENAKIQLCLPQSLVK